MYAYTRIVRRGESLEFVRRPQRQLNGTTSPPDLRWCGSGLSALNTSDITVGRTADASGVAAMLDDYLHPDFVRRVRGGEKLDDLRLGRAPSVYTCGERRGSVTGYSIEPFTRKFLHASNIRSRTWAKLWHLSSTR